jgi:hypothetical protein
MAAQPATSGDSVKAIRTAEIAPPQIGSGIWHFSGHSNTQPGIDDGTLGLQPYSHEDASDLTRSHSFPSGDCPSNGDPNLQTLEHSLPSDLAWDNGTTTGSLYLDDYLDPSKYFTLQLSKENDADFIALPIALVDHL